MSLLPGLGFWWCALYHITPYKTWNALGWVMHLSCFPVDILIFYKEPFGPVGTLVAQVFAFIPFYIVTGKQKLGIMGNKNVLIEY